MKIKYRYRRLKNYFNVYIKLPHVWILLAIIALAMIMISLSLYYLDKDQFLSSLCSNIFAGLLTGIIICLISTIKSIVAYKTESEIMWLTNLHKDCLKYLEMSKKIKFYKRGDFQSDEELYDYIYDVLCAGNDISVSISQGQFKKFLPFNPYKYFIKKFQYDAIEHERINSKLRDRILDIDISQMKVDEIRDLFKDMNATLFSLNLVIIRAVDELEIRKKAINVSLL